MNGEAVWWDIKEIGKGVAEVIRKECLSLGSINWLLGRLWFRLVSCALSHIARNSPFPQS